MLQAARSLLFTPGNVPRMLERALASPADILIVDFEDAVPAGEKATARRGLHAIRREEEGPPIWVRVNGIGTEWFEDDVIALNGADIEGVVVPKASTAALHRLLTHVDRPAIALVETAAGLTEARTIAKTDGVAALALGAVDLAADLRLEPLPDGKEFLLARSILALESRAAGLRRPFDSIHVGIHDTDALAAECRTARALGFGGKLCIHPSQTTVVNAIFDDAGSIDEARAIIAGYEAAVATGRGSASVGGKMIDLASVRAAERLIQAGSDR